MLVFISAAFGPWLELSKQREMGKSRIQTHQGEPKTAQLANVAKELASKPSQTLWD